MAKLGYADAGNQLRERQIGNEEAKVAGLAPKTQAEIDKIKADTALSNARTKAVQTGKPAKSDDGTIDAEDFDTDKRFISSAIKEKKALAEYERATRDALKSFSEGGNYNLWEGYAPSIDIGGTNVTKGKRSEYNAYVAKVATQVIDKVPGIRSDSDFRNLVQPMLPSPGDPKDVVKKKLEIFKNFLEARKPETTTYDMLSDKDKMRIGGKQAPPKASNYKGDFVTQGGVMYQWNGQGYQEYSGVK
jgi:hypothetical protein